jgi:hypothetical protein
MTSPDDRLRAIHARSSARDRAMLARITGPKPDPDSETLPDPAEMLAAAVADNTNQEENA